MRILSLTRDPGAWSPLEFHPSLTVVFSDDPSLRKHLVASLTELYALAGSEVTGTIEYSGFEMPLDQTSVVSLDLHGDGPVAVDRTELDRIRSKVRSVLTSSTEEQSAELRKELDSIVPELAAAARRVDVTVAAMGAGTEELTLGEERLLELAAALDELRSRSQQLATELDDAVQTLETQRVSAARVDDLTTSLIERLDPTGQYVAGLRIGDPTEAVRDELRELIEFGQVEASTPGSILEWLETMQSGEAEPSSTVVDRLDEIAQLDAQWQELTRVGVEGDQSVLEARREHETALERLSWLEELAESGLLADRARAEIDDAHESGDSSTESEVLDRYGFESYLDYTIALSTRSVGEALDSTLSIARAGLVRCSDGLEAAREQAAEIRSTLGNRRDELREEVREHTGVDPQDLSAETLSLIPERPVELDGLAAVLGDGASLVHEQLESCNHAVESIRAELDALSDGTDIDLQMAAERQRLDELELLLTKATEVHDRNIAEHGSLSETVDSLNDRLGESDARVESLRTPSSSIGAQELDALTEHLADRLGGPDRDPVPVILVEPTSGRGDAPPDIEEFSRRLAAITQVVLVSGDESVLRWAKRLNADSGLLVRPGKRAWFGRRLAKRQRERSVAPADSD